MTGRLRLLLVAVIALLAGYGVMLAVWPDARPSLPSAPWHAEASGDHASHQKASDARYEKIAAEILIPSAAECGPLTGCPMKRLGTILGVRFSDPHGLQIGALDPEGPAAKAGLQPGDQLGLRTECPSSTIDYFLPKEEARTVSVTARRWHKRHEGSGADGEPADQPEDQAGPPAEEEAGPPSEDEPEPSP
jgi:hypothetical protein